VLRVAAFAGSGVMLSTAFLHLLLPAQETLRSPCLPNAWLQGYPDAALLIAASTVALAMVFEFFFESAVLARRGGRGRNFRGGGKERSLTADDNDTKVAGGEQRDDDEDAAAAAATAAAAASGMHFAHCGERRDVEHALSAPVDSQAAAAAAAGSAFIGEGASASKAVTGLLPLPEATAEAEETTAAARSGSKKQPLVPGLSAREHEKGTASCCRKGECARGMRHRLLDLVLGSSSPSTGEKTGEGEENGALSLTLSAAAETTMTTAKASSSTSSSSPRILELAGTECSICAHSIIIGVALGTTPERSAFVPLLVALLFHQLLEGVALGSAATAAGVRPRSRASLALAALFAITTPLGAAIGLGIRSLSSGAGAGAGSGSVDPSTSRASLFAMGIADAVAAGTLLHLSTGDHCANALRSSAPWLRSKGPAMHGACVGAFLAGGALMAYIAVWA
jgi:hypothetical protein